MMRTVARRSWCVWLMTLGCCWCAGQSLAQSADPDRLQAQAIEMTKQVRCPGSANLSLFDSESPVSGEIKALIYVKLEQGQSPEQVMDFLTERYGEQIRYRPGFTAATGLLWLAPVGLILMAAGSVLLRIRRSNRNKKKLDL